MKIIKEKSKIAKQVGKIKTILSLTIGRLMFPDDTMKDLERKIKDGEFNFETLIEKFYATLTRENEEKALAAHNSHRKGSGGPSKGDPGTRNRTTQMQDLQECCGFRKSATFEIMDSDAVPEETKDL